MKQAIIFGVIISIFAFLCVSLYDTISYGNTTTTTFELVQDGEVLYSIPLTPHIDKVVWYIQEDNGNQIVLEDREILEYYGFSQTYDSLSNSSNIDWDTIYAKSGEDAEVNMFYIQGTTVTMYATSSDSDLCLEGEAISKPGESTICAPHKLVGEIKGDGDSNV